MAKLAYAALFAVACLVTFLLQVMLSKWALRRGRRRWLPGGVERGVPPLELLDGPAEGQAQELRLTPSSCTGHNYTYTCQKSGGDLDRASLSREAESAESIAQLYEGILTGPEEGGDE